MKIFMKILTKRIHREKDGVTLLEIVIALGIFALVGGAVGTFARDLFVYSGGVSNSLSAQQDARAILRDFAAEVREAQLAANGAYPIEKADNNELIFFSDIDKDGTRDRVRYYLSGNSLMKDVTIPTGSPPGYTGAPKIKTLIHDTANGGTPFFSYYNTSYDGTAAALVQPVTISVVRLVKANVIIERDPNRSPTPITVTTQVSFRNLKDNL
ncbi:MAG: hypothetical protein AAB545_01785 [Patescibacteria group bacterium]